jgi:hypothetical protein
MGIMHGCPPRTRRPPNTCTLLRNKAVHYNADTWASTGDALGDGVVYALAIAQDDVLYAGGELQFLYQANQEEKIGGRMRMNVWCMRCSYQQYVHMPVHNQNLHPIFKSAHATHILRLQG